MVVKDLGVVDYLEAWNIQKELFEKKKIAKQKKESPVSNYLLLCEHPHVITLGKFGKQNNLIVSPEILKKKGVDFYAIDRGGDITYHGPGQLVVYPIIDMDQYKLGVKSYVYLLEQIIIDLLQEYSIVAERLTGATGVWINVQRNPQKICAIGIKCSLGITMHGLAFNINTDVNYFNLINPCGFTDKSVISMEKIIGATINIQVIKEQFILLFKQAFKNVSI